MTVQEPSLSSVAMDSINSPVYEEGAFTILVSPREEPHVWNPQASHTLRDRMLSAIFPESDINLLGKSDAGRAAKLLLRIAFAPEQKPQLHPTRNTNAQYEEAKRYSLAYQWQYSYESHPGKGVTVINPQGIIDSRVTSKTGDIITAYLKAVTGLRASS